MSTRIRLISVNSGEETPFDGQYLVEYDPSRPGVDPNGRPLLAHIVTTPDPEKARVFDNAMQALETWRATSGKIRDDGKPDRPLTAFTVSLE